jgi:hypothetical protein
MISLTYLSTATERFSDDDYLDTKPLSEESGRDLGRAGVFHRGFRDRMG